MSFSAHTPITSSSVVALTWVLKDMQGEVLDTLEEPVEFFVGGGDLLQSIVDALLQHAGGNALHLHLEPEQAFGDYDENKVFVEPRSGFPQELEEGMVFDGHGLPAGCSSDMPQQALYIVTDIYPEHVVLDGNHPLAGMALVFTCTVTAVRPASADEIAHGHIHDGDCDHDD